MSHIRTSQPPATDHEEAAAPERTPDDDSRTGASGGTGASGPSEPSGEDGTRSPGGADGDTQGEDGAGGPVEADGRADEEPGADTASETATATAGHPGEAAGESAAGGAEAARPSSPDASDNEPAKPTPLATSDGTSAKPPTADTPDDEPAKPSTLDASDNPSPLPSTTEPSDGTSPRPSTPEPSDNASPEPSTPDTPVARGWRARRPALARALSWTVTGLALVLVLFALIVPNDIHKLAEPERFVRIPAEGILGAALLLLLPPRSRKLMAVVEGVVLGLLVILKCLDMGFYWTLDRPFDLVLDWILLDDAQSFVKDSFGEGGALAATIGLFVVLAGLVVLLVLSVLRLTRLMVRNRHTTGRTLLILGTAWITCSTLTLEFSGVPVASHSAATLVENRVEAVRTGLKDGKAFEKQAAIDAFADVPPDQLLTGLRGKDVLITFIESYGRSAIDDPQMGVPLGETLTQKTQELKDAGYASRSGWLRSPITGAGSWLGHSTFLSGLWIKNQSRYNHLVASDRLTLTEAFRRTGAWRTVGVVPGTQKAWPEGKYFGLNHIYDSDELGYKGPKFSWSTMPDQYTLKAFEKLEHGKKDRGPMMAEIILTSSHNPWAPIPSTIPEDQVGDGSVYYDLQKREGKNPEEVWKDASKVRDEYRKSIQYSVTSLVDYVAKYGSKDTVLIFLGDHQPNKTVTGEKPNHDVPVSIVAQDPKVLDKIADWGYTDGLKPADNAPEWRMDKFRDRFMTAFGPQGGATG